MVAAVRTPLHHGGSLSLGNRKYRKEILIKGPLHVNGETFDVSDAYLDEIKRAFDAGAIRSVPVQLAPGDNSHSEDLSRRRGQIVGLARTARGLDADVELNDEAARMIDDWPDTGVSVLVKHDRTTGEGEHFAAALAHLLITADPVLTTLQPWSEAIAAAHDDKSGDVLDLLSLSLASDATTDETAVAERRLADASDELARATAAEKEAAAAYKAARAATATALQDTSSDEGALPDPSEGNDPMPKLADLLNDASEDDLKALRARLDELAPVADDDSTEEEPVDETGEPEVTDDDLAEAEAILADLDFDEPVEESPVDTPAEPVVAASQSSDQSDAQALALAQAQEQVNAQGIALAQVRRELDDARWREERDALGAANVPPVLVELAKPFLHASDSRLALSQDGHAKAAAQVRKMLTEVGKLTKDLRLGQPAVGTAQDASEAAEQAETDKTRASAVRKHINDSGIGGNRPRSSR